MDSQSKRAQLPSEYLGQQQTGKPQINPNGVANSLNWVYINGLGARSEKCFEERYSYCNIL